MALDKATLKTSIKQAFINALGATPTVAQDSAFDSLAENISNAVDTYVKTATVTVASGIPVSTTGTAAAQTGATTSPGTGSLS